MPMHNAITIQIDLLVPLNVDFCTTYLLLAGAAYIYVLIEQ